MKNPEIESRKKSLQQKSKDYEEQITQEVDSLKDKAVNASKYALVAGGIAVAGFIIVKFLYNVIVKSDEERQDDVKIVHLPVEQPAMFPVVKEAKEQPLVVRMIMSAIATFLLTIAKQKLTQFIEDLYKNEADKDSKPAA